MSHPLSSSEAKHQAMAHIAKKGRKRSIIETEQTMYCAHRKSRLSEHMVNFRRLSMKALRKMGLGVSSRQNYAGNSPNKQRLDYYAHDVLDPVMIPEHAKPGDIVEIQQEQLEGPAALTVVMPFEGMEGGQVCISVLSANHNCVSFRASIFRWVGQKNGATNCCLLRIVMMLGNESEKGNMMLMTMVTGIL